ncbi:hypothetical protein [Nocardia caishijiensis]|uniref:hypothetical protein n=1 Tax=Nocardia caishijiensis TaxID=184756 RepID=UPI00082CB2D5|nr:hypothetical protein [Nocardia caishijiensis]
MPVTVVVTVIAVSAALPAALDRWTRAHPPASAPADLCEAVGAARFQRWVPAGVRDPDSTYSSGSDAMCTYRTPTDEPGHADAYGYLQVRVLRYGDIGWTSGTERAVDALEFACGVTPMAGSFGPDEGFGDEACLARGDSGDETAAATLVVQHGADLISVDHYRRSATPEFARLAVEDVATAALAALR